jgi:hypothetical protein
MKEQMKKYKKMFKINERTINYLLILILGFLVGVAVKTEAKKKVTIGYNDYLVGDMKQDFDLMKKEIVPTDPSQGETVPPEGGSQPQ